MSVANISPVASVTISTISVPTKDLSGPTEDLSVPAEDLPVTELQWATDIHNEQNNYWNKLILSVLSHPKFTIKFKSITNLYNGISIYKYQIVQNYPEPISVEKSNLSPVEKSNLSSGESFIISSIDNILGLIEKICYIPIEFSLIENESIIKKADMDVIIENSKTLITAHIKSELYIEVDYVEVTTFMIDFKNNIKVHKFIPYANDHKIYETSKRNAYINQVCNLNKSIGYRFLSDNPLIKIIVDKYAEQEPTFDKSNVKMNAKMYLYKVTISSDLTHFNQLTKMLQEYINIGYFTIPRNLEVLEYNLYDDIYPEIALSWNITLIDSWKYNSFQRIYCFQQTSNIIDNVELFLQTSAQRIIDGKLPILTFSNRWVQNLNWNSKSINVNSVGSVSSTTSNDSSKEYDELLWMKFFYLLIKSYTELIVDHPILFDYLDSVVLNPDFTITAAFANHSQYQQFQTILDNQFTNVDKVSSLFSKGELQSLFQEKNMSDTMDRLFIETTSSLTNALAVRWYWQTVDEDSNSLIIKSNEKYYIIVDTHKKDISGITVYLQGDIQRVINYIDKLNKSNIQEDIIESSSETTSEEVNVSTTSPEVNVSTTSPEINVSTTSPEINIPTTSSEVNVNSTPAEVTFKNNFKEDIKDKLLLKYLERENEQLKLSRRDFLKNLKEHYINCRHDEDIITKEQISNMNILDLLEIIIVQYENEQHCFSREYVLKTGVHVDPATGFFLNERTIRIMKQQEFGIRGYFGYGILNGILSDIPDVPTLNIEKTKVDINIVDNYLTIDFIVDSQNLVSRSFYEKHMIEEFILKIAEIDLSILDKKSGRNFTSEEEINDFAGIFIDLWKSGKLMSDWGFQLLYSYGKISRKCFKENKAANMAVENDVFGRRFISRILEIYS